VAVRIPSEADERVRDVVRCRETFQREILKSRHYILKFLATRGFVFREGTNWCTPHLKWLQHLTTEQSLLAAADRRVTVPLGSALVVDCTLGPDQVRETFEASTEHGGHDGDGRSIRYLEWTHEPAENDTTYAVDYVYLLREGAGAVKVVHERHTCGVFPRAEWLRLLGETGFEPQVIVDSYGRDVFIGIKHR